MAFDSINERNNNLTFPLYYLCLGKLTLSTDRVPMELSLNNQKHT